MMTADIEIRVGADLPTKALTDLYESVGWLAYTRGPRAGDLRDAVMRSSYVVSAWRGETLVGLARVLSDDSAVMLLQDVLVRPEEQGQGIGTRLVRRCLDRFSHVRSKLLLTDDREQQLRFYRHLGFTNIADLVSARLNAFVQIEGVD